MISTIGGATRKLKAMFVYHGFPNRRARVIREERTVKAGYDECGFFNVLAIAATFDEAIRRANVNLTGEVLWEKKNGIRRSA